MQLLEFQAKRLLQESGLPVPSGQVTLRRGSLPLATFPAVVKSQVPVGGRGKLGGIRVVTTETELQEAAETLWELDIKGFQPETLLIEEALDIERELYLALRLNRDERRVEWLVSENGGMEIEAHSDAVTAVDRTQTNASHIVSHSLTLSLHTLQQILTKLEECFFDNDLLLLEINPLVVTSSGTLVCADAKIMVDDNSHFRHESFDWPEPEAIKPLGGSVGVIANGAGMAMSTMDTIYAAGGKPANFLDIGGGTGEDVFVKNLRAINELPGVSSIIVNIFAGITRCDDIARGIIAAEKQIKNLVPLFIRLEGTNKDEAADLLKQAHITLQPDLKSCIKLALHAEGKRPASESPLSTKPLRPRSSEAQTNKPLAPSGVERKDGESEQVSQLLTNQPTIVQGITGHHGAFHTEQMLKAGTHIVAGVTPGKGGETVHGVPVYNTVTEAVKNHSASASVIFVPAKFAKAAAFETIEAGIREIVIITEGIPVLDMLAIHEKATAAGVTVIGPNCPGLIVPDSHKLGIIAAHITKPGNTTIISRSGTLTYELANALTKKGIGQRLILGIGGDPIQGMTFVEALEIAERDPETTQIIIVGEIGGEGENMAADFTAEHVTKPVYGLIVGHSLPAGQTFGHAGAVVGHHGESAAQKTAYMASRGVAMAGTLDELIASIQP